MCDGTGASSLTSLEEKQQNEADLREELIGKDCEIECLKKVVSEKELLNEQQAETIRRLESDASKTHSVVSAATVLTKTVEQLRSKLDEKDAEVRRLTEESTELKACTTLMTDSDEVSFFCRCKLSCTCCVIILNFHSNSVKRFFS